MGKILNSRGEPIVLNAHEQRIAHINQKLVNALGFEIDITTLTTIVKKVTEQKFFEIAPADYVPVKVGDGAWSAALTTYRSFQLGDDFATGVMNTGASNSRMATADAGVDSLTIPVKNWAKEVNWSLFDLQLAAKSGNWDLVTAKEKARKRNWDLGIQKVAFLGLGGDTGVLGLYTQAGVTNNLTRITAPLSSLTTANLKLFLAGFLDDYRANCNRTAWPTAFIIPESDFLGLAAPASDTFPIRSTLSLIEETLKVMTKNPNFKVLPNAYGDPAYNSLGVHRYILLNQDEESIRMDIPVDYTNTLANSIDNFSYHNVGYGQFTGVLAYRPAETLYYSY